MLAPTPHQRHHDKVEKRLLEKFRVSNVLLDSDEHAKINEMVARVAKLAAEDNLREDDGVYTASRMYKVTPGMVNRSFVAHTKPVYGVYPFSDGVHVATIGMDSMFVWAMDQADPVASVGRSAVTANQCLTRGAVTGSRVAICAGSEPSTCRWNDQAQTLTVQHRGTRFGHDDVITCSCFTPDGSILVTASMDTTCIFWQADTMALLGVLHAHHGGVSWCGFSPDGQFLFTCGALDYLTKRWAVSAWLAAHAAGGTNSTTTPPVLSEQPPSASASEVIGSALTAPTNPASLDEPAATLHDQSYHHVTPPLQPSRLLDWSARQKYNRALDSLFSPDITLQTLTGEHHLPQFCMNDDWSRNRHTQNQPDLLLPPLYEFTSSDDGTIGLREAADDPAALTQLESIDILSLLDPTSSTKHPLCHDRVSFEANDIPLDVMPVVVFECRTTHGVCGSSDSFVKIWNPSTFECVYTLRGHFDSVLSVAFTPSGTCVYSAGHDAQVIKWQVIPTGPSKVKKPCTLSDVDTRSVMLEWLVPTANGAAISHYHIRCIPEDPLDMEPTVDIRVSVDEIQADTRAAHDAIQAEIDRKAKIREDRRIAANAKRPKRTEKRVERSEKLRKQSDQRKERLETHSSLSTTLLSSVAADIPVRPVVPATLKFKVSCVHPGTIYQFEIAAENRCGIQWTPLDSPDAPAAPTISNITSHTVDMTWEKPRHNGSDIVHYTLEWAQDGRDVESVVVLTRSLPTTVHTVTQLAAGTWIQVRVQASNVIDKVVLESPFSPWSGRVKTLPSVPAAPAKPVLASATSHTLTVNFSFQHKCGDRKPIQRYHVMLFIEDDSYGVVSQRFCQQLVWSLDELTTVENDGFKAELVGLKASKRYVVAMAAENELGKGDFSPVSQGAPMVSNVHPTKVDLAWTVPSHDGGSAVTAYAIEYSLNDGPFENELKIQRLDTTLTLDFLKPKATYSFRVAGVNAAGTATYSPPTDPITTPSLVEHTLRLYFLNRPPQEHIAATSIQVVWSVLKCSKTYMT
ncbi:hypothetical protein DYB35_000098 [Aphanomyces astaci]|uniref:Fibronectin type-III domain-containing protein n=2 Tax=Aphanomyces astaci TaxID=112090 RepID=A0A3R6ZSZ2_APHAT|nr:hypothetical protein DYB35_000098 [Aphanomyces astaci]